MRVLVAGDYVPRERISNMMINGDFSYLNEVKEITKDTDLSIVNLEAPIVINEAKPIQKCGPNLETSKEVVNSLKYGGFNMVTLANNHIMDYGEVGLKDTIQSLNNGKIKYVGVGDNLKEAERIEYFEKDGKKLAIINCCEHEYSIATSDKSGANPLNPIQQYYAITEAKKNADYVMVIVHGGHEHFQLPSLRMKETYRFFIDAGADVVVNHHQHCFSGYEEYKGKMIFYGLGNFCFEALSKVGDFWFEGFMIKLDFSDKINYELIPYIQCKEEASVKLLGDRTIFNQSLSLLNQILEDDNLLESKLRDFYLKGSSSVKGILEPYRGRILNAAYYRGLLPSLLSNSKLIRLDNLIQCESHLDKLRMIIRSFINN